MDSSTRMSTCRFSNHGDFQPEQFDSFSCSACFYFIFMLVKPYSEEYVTLLCPNANGLLVCPRRNTPEDCSCDNPKYVYNIPDFALNKSRITALEKLQLDPPLTPQFDYLVKDCCSAARYCCRNTLVNYDDKAPFSCPATWDGWNCFDRTNAGKVVKQCPTYIYGGLPHTVDNINNFATKECSNAGWELFEMDKEHTDYSGCSVNKDAETKIMVGIVTYCTSVVAVIPAVIMLMWLRPIRCQPMFILHRHLLLSCLAYGFFYLLNVCLFVITDAPLSSQLYSSHHLCKLLFSIQLRYLRLTNFCWMLAEAVYLWRLLYTAQHTSKDENQTTYKIVCWLLPAVITFIYMILRGLFDDVGMCWIENSSVVWVEWMIFAPSLLIMGVNLLILCVVVYILFKKLACDPHLERMQYTKAVRGAFLLIPVFGVQQLLTIYRFENTFYQVLDQASNGLQGLFVALIVCYTNRSVLDCVAKFWSSHQEKRALGAECRQRMSIQESGKLLLRSTQQTEHVVL